MTSPNLKLLADAVPLGCVRLGGSYRRVVYWAGRHWDACFVDELRPAF